MLYFKQVYRDPRTSPVHIWSIFDAYHVITVISALSAEKTTFTVAVHHSTQMKSLLITDCTIQCAMNGITMRIASSNVTETAFAIAVIWKSVGQILSEKYSTLENSRIFEILFLKILFFGLKIFGKKLSQRNIFSSKMFRLLREFWSCRKSQSWKSKWELFQLGWRWGTI